MHYITIRAIIEWSTADFYRFQRKEEIIMKASLPYKYITSVKNGKQYVVFDFKDKAGKRKRKWVSTGMSEICTKKALNEAVEKIVAEFAEKWNNN